ncbi:MAG TPA: TRAM domain-containing protein [Candidatus Dormibacteraeota bacterium]
MAEQSEPGEAPGTIAAADSAPAHLGERPGQERASRIASLVGMSVGAVLGTLYATVVISTFKANLPSWEIRAVVLAAGLALGCGLGYLLGPVLSVRPYVWAEEELASIPMAELVGGLAGVFVALAIAALVALIASGLPGGLGWLVAVLVAFVLVPLGISVGRRRRREISSLGLPLGVAAAPLARVVVDTSAIIDGRLLDLARTGFCIYELQVPQFVLAELQAVADSADPIRRARGRRGLAMLEELRSLPGLDLQFPLTDYPSMPEVDAKLVRLAREVRAALLTVDFNLDRVAQIEGVTVLNLNQLATALRPALVPGERLEVDVVKEGREADQGVGYLPDGTMLVVEGGRAHLGERVSATVRSVLQTASGRMVFVQAADLEEGAPSAPPSSGPRAKPAPSHGA